MQIAPRKVINAWCLYDWANSAYNLVITSTIFPAYFEAITKDRLPNNEIEFMGRNYVNTALYIYVLGLAFVVVALMSPILSSIADYKGNKKNFMRFFCILGSVSCMALYFFAPENVAGASGELSRTSINTGVICMFISCIAFWGSLVFYNSYLPDLVPEHLRDRISARGFTWGYIGSVILQIVCFIVVFFPDAFGLMANPQDNYGKHIMPARISFVLVGLWWLIFGLLSARRLPMSSAKERNERKNVLTNGFIELKKVWAQVRKMPVLGRFLLSFFWYSAGVQTVFLAATQFGAKELELPTDKLIITIMIIQLVAIPGAILISRMAERFGELKTLMAVVLVWIAICVGGYFIHTDIEFYILGAVVGLVMGGIQSLGRSTYSNLMPETKDTTSFFSFYDVTEKIGLVIGMFSFAYIEELTGSMRNSVLVLMTFFIASFLALAWTLIKQKRSAQH